MQPTSPSRRASRLGTLAFLGVFGQVFFAVVVALLPFFQPGYSSVNNAISTLLLGPYGLVLSAALFAAGIGSIALAFGIRQTTRGSRGSLLGSALIGLWGIGFALAGIVLTDADGNPTETGLTLHAAAVGLAFLAVVPGILVLSRVFVREARWSSFYPLSLALGFATVVGIVDMITIATALAGLREAVGPMIRSFEGLGLIQRVFVGTVVLWMMLAAARLRSVAKDKNERFSTVGR